MASTIRKLIKAWLKPVRQAFGRFALNETAYTGTHGCLRTAASFVAHNMVEGDYLEFGVFEGESFVAAFHAIERERGIVIDSFPKTDESAGWFDCAPRYFAFDSFAGLPGGDAERQADYHAGAYACSEAQFRKNVADGGVDVSRLITVPGLYGSSLTQEVKAGHGLRRAAVVMIDCDLYESTVPVLDFLTDLVHQGTVIIFHDWFRFKGSPLQGEQRACGEWLRRNPSIELIEYWREGPQAMAFIVNIRQQIAY